MRIVPPGALCWPTAEWANLGGQKVLIFFFIFSKYMIIKDQQTTLDSMNATVNTKFEYPQIFHYVFIDFLKNSLTRPFFELEKCSFFLNGSEFRQKLIGTIITAVFPTKWATTRHF